MQDVKRNKPSNQHSDGARKSPFSSGTFFQPAVQPKTEEGSTQEEQIQRKPAFSTETSPFFSASGVQAKLKIGQPGDRYEREADSVADQIVNGESSGNEVNNSPAGVQKKPQIPTITPLVQRKTESEESLQAKEEEKLQAKEEEGGGLLQMSADANAGDDSGNLESQLNSNKGGGSPLDNGTRSKMESGFGKDFSGVRVHNDSNAVQMNNDLGSQAFTHGNDIYFNEGKYNPSSKEGEHLLAHELTHTVQQGASNQPAVQKAEKKTEPTGEVTKPSTPLDITHRFELTKAWADYLDAQYAKGTRKFEVDVKIGERYSGTILVRKLNGTETGELAKYDLVSTGNQKYLEINGWSFMDPLRAGGATPILVLNSFGEEQTTTGFLSVKLGDTPLLKDALGFVKGINKNLESMRMLGIKPLDVGADFENTFEQGHLVFQVNTMNTVVDGFLEAGGGMGITGETFTFNLSTKVDVAGLAQGEFTIARSEDGNLSGSGDIEAEIANVQAKIHVEYLEGIVTIQGTGRIESEKFSGEITLLVTDAARSKQMMNAELGVETMDAEQESAETTPTPKSKGNQVLAGWGEVKASITPWLEGTAKVGIDNEGHVTIVGEIAVPNEIELMEQRGKKVDIFKLEIRAGYGIPLVGQVFLFASIGMFMNAGFGPLTLKDVAFTGTYSTDPSVLQEFAITGTLSINAFAILGLEAEAGVGLTILGHDVKAGVNVTAAAGLRAYAEATPTLEYKEQAAPEGGKTGETRLKGHFEAAAQLFAQLSGAFFVEIDAPWWSPVSDGREEYPMGEVQYPIGDSLGVGADMDWLVGSPDIPELKFSPIEFDADKFTADIMADPPPKKYGKSDDEKAGEWVDGNKPGDQQDNPELKDGEGLPENEKKKEDLKKLPDEEKYMRALDEMSKLEKASPKPTYSVVDAKAKKVKSKYGLDKITVKNKDEEAEVFVKHAKEDNGDHLLMIPLMSEAERLKLLSEAMKDLEKSSDAAVGEDGTIEESKAKEVLATWKKAHPVVEDAHVVDGEQTWDYFIDLGDKSDTMKGKKKKVEAKEDGVPGEEGDGEIGEIVKFSAGKENHTLWIEINGNAVAVMVASTRMTVKGRLTAWKTLMNKKGNESLKEKGEAKITSGLALFETIQSKAEEARTSVDDAKKNALDDQVEKAQNTLKPILIDLFEIFGDDNNVIETYKDQFAKMSANVKIHFYDTIEKSPEKFKEVASWQDLVNKVKGEDSVISLIYSHPMTKAHDFGKYIQENPASKALEAVLSESKKSDENKQLILDNKLKWIDDRAGNVKNKDTNESGAVFDELQKQIEDTSSGQVNATFYALKAYFKDSMKSGSTEHDKFKPVPIGDPVVNGDLTTITYGYAGGSEKFTVTYNNKTNETSSVTAESISFHGFGRGKTEGETKEGMDRAHIVGNEVRGTGYVEGHNLMLTSSQFNQKVMRDKEIEIAAFLNIGIESLGAVSTFDMHVKVERFEMSESMPTTDLISKLTKRKESLESATAAFDDEKKKTSARWAELQTINELLLLTPEQIVTKLELGKTKKNEKRVKDVIYTIKKVTYISGTTVEPNKRFVTGPDIFLGIDE